MWSRDDDDDDDAGDGDDAFTQINDIFSQSSVNPWKRSGVRWLHFELFSAIQV